MAGNSGVGGAGQLNIELFKKELEKIEWTAEGHCAGADTGSYTAKLWPWLTKQIINAALAAKAPQGVPTRIECKCDPEYAHRCAVCGGKGYIDAPKLPAPVSDDTIHHGMVPPGTPHSSEAPCMTCGRPKPVIYAVNVQACPGCFQPFDTREAAAPKPTTLLAEAIANELMSQNMLDVTVKQAIFPIQRVLEAAAPKPAPPISEFTPENMPVVTVSGGAPPNASPPSWKQPEQNRMGPDLDDTCGRCGFKSSKPHEMVEHLRNCVAPAPGAERALPFRKVIEWLHHTLAAAQNTPYEEGDVCEDCTNTVLDELVPLVREALAAAPPAPTKETIMDIVKRAHELVEAHSLPATQKEPTEWPVKVTCKCGTQIEAISRDALTLMFVNHVVMEALADRHASAERVQELERALPPGEKS